MTQPDKPPDVRESSSAASGVPTSLYHRYVHLVTLAADLAELGVATTVHLVPLEGQPVMYASRWDGHTLPVLVTRKPDGLFRYLWNGGCEADVGQPENAARRIADGEVVRLLGSITVPRHPDHVPYVRHWMRRLLAGHPEVADAETCICELFTNSVRYARGQFVSLTILDTGMAIRTEVVDGGNPHRSPGALSAQASLTDPCGRGLLMVEKLASDWGTRICGDGNRMTYFTLKHSRRTAS